MNVLLRIALGLSLACLPACSHDSRRPAGAETPAPKSPPAASPAPSSSPEKPAAPEAKAPPPRDGVLKDLEKKIRPDVPPTPRSPADDPAVLTAQAKEMLESWMKDLAAGRLEAARSALVSEKDLEEMAGEGLYNILAATLLPENQKNLAEIIDVVRGKEANLEKWKEGKLFETGGSNTTYRRNAHMMREVEMEVFAGDQRVPLSLDLLSVGGRWKVFRLDYKEPREKE